MLNDLGASWSLSRAVSEDSEGIEYFLETLVSFLSLHYLSFLTTSTGTIQISPERLIWK